MDRILIDFVAGSHGHYLESVCNVGFNFVNPGSVEFNKLGSSHNKAASYHNTKVFIAKHWHLDFNDSIKDNDQLVLITFTHKDLLLLSSLSWLRASDSSLDNNLLEVNTVQKLKTDQYKNVLEEIYSAYPFLDRSNPDIPRYVLREFFKFSFRNPNENGLWKQLQQMQTSKANILFRFQFESFYNIDMFKEELSKLSDLLNVPFKIDNCFASRHAEFLKLNPYRDVKQQCDQIINAVQTHTAIPIPNLTLFQESFINSQLENIFGKEMPFHQNTFFKQTSDIIEYLKTAKPC